MTVIIYPISPGIVRVQKTETDGYTENREQAAQTVAMWKSQRLGYGETVYERQQRIKDAEEVVRYFKTH